MGDELERGGRRGWKGLQRGPNELFGVVDMLTIFIPPKGSHYIHTLNM